MPDTWRWRDKKLVEQHALQKPEELYHHNFFRKYRPKAPEALNSTILEPFIPKARDPGSPEALKPKPLTTPQLFRPYTLIDP